MLIGPVVGGYVVEALSPAAGSLAEGYALMWLVMIVSVVLAGIVIVYWNMRKARL